MYSKNNLNILNLTRLNNDSCFKKQSINNNKKIFKYYCKDLKQSLVKTKKKSLNLPTLQYKDGHGWLNKNGKNIDNDSNIRLKNKLTNLNIINQLNTRIIKNDGFRGNNCMNKIENESNLIFSKNTKINKACNKNNSGKYHFLPQINNIKYNIQNTKNIIQEDSNIYWIRGGIPSRYLK
jgi:hypothetical protein